MKNNFEGSDKNEGNENNDREIHCSEQEWRGFLNRAKSESKRFLKFYETLPVNSNEDRLDKCAVAMGWQLSGTLEDEGASAPAFEFDFEILPPPAPPPVYSLQNTPECIALSALFSCVQKRWDEFLRHPASREQIPAYLGANLARTLAEAERDMLLGIDAIDAGEYNLAIALMKDVHTSLNKHFSEMESLPAASNTQQDSQQIKKIYEVLFDIREMSLRIIRDAQETLLGNNKKI